MKKINKKAFTLIEVIVVVAIIGILVLLGIPRFTGYTQRAELARIQHDVKVMEQEIGTEFINNDDDFNEWENNSKDFNQLIQESKLFEKEGIAKKVESTDETYKVIPEKYKDKINTKLKGIFYANSHGKVYYEHAKSVAGMPTEPENPDTEEPEDGNDGETGGNDGETGGNDGETGGNDGDIGGNGGLMNPVEPEAPIAGEIPIATAEDLASIRSTRKRIYGEGTEWAGEYAGGLDKEYVQVANIDLSDYSKEIGWTPIGNSSSRFTGSFDGNGYKITGLAITKKQNDYIGLFGATEKATISNVALEDISVKGRYEVGGLVGFANNSTKISNSYVTGLVEGESHVGGLVGYAYSHTTISNSYTMVDVTGTEFSVGGLVGDTQYGATINNSYTTGSVKGKDRVGGIVGHAYANTKISNSYATGSVEGSGQYAGGIVGWANSSTISNSYATGSVKGEDRVGGLVGQAQNNNTISNSYATGQVTGTSYLGGLVGWASDGLKITSSYWDINTTGQTTSAGEGEGASEGKTTVEMKNAGTYSAWGTDVWNIVNGKYPTLK